MAKNQVSLVVTGMTCAHCVKRVERALTECGAQGVKVDLGTGAVSLLFDGELDQVMEAVTQAGYGIVAFEMRPV